ncbi:MAG: 2-amino-4-hydroxy-6-hydroxymethyldihydropteridine diphosphokinase [Opitutales bacterium]|jgi:2-amino-4-hydroxy-6-hydroxymethyldihydropteridine diphosphokinase|nr:2-amino-4-hydroxy-6-hydroxymethyldihydropteridine diphosphokinase [Opitutales bacterium]MDP4777823.1 2-amino-4-hydroxy-6-hydroxymethyldihydropteridine diphosphokinase [Opitutales bacterium]
MPLTTAYLALGSNLGDRLSQMRDALRLLEADYAIRILRSSAVYQNRAIGMENAEDFLNAVVAVETGLAPEALLYACLAVETKLGRVRSGVWAPRTIDLDVLAYGDRVIETERLQLPHPRIAERDFVAQPLLEVAPDLVVFGQSIQAIVAALPAIDLELWAERLR